MRIGEGNTNRSWLYKESWPSSVGIGPVRLFPLKYLFFERIEKMRNWKKKKKKKNEQIPQSRDLAKF